MSHKMLLLGVIAISIATAASGKKAEIPATTAPQLDGVLSVACPPGSPDCTAILQAAFDAAEDDDD